MRDYNRIPVPENRPVGKEDVESPNRPIGSFVSELECQSEAMLSVVFDIYTKLFGDVDGPAKVNDNKPGIDSRLSDIIDINSMTLRALSQIVERL